MVKQLIVVALLLCRVGDLFNNPVAAAPVQAAVAESAVDECAGHHHMGDANERAVANDTTSDPPSVHFGHDGQHCKAGCKCSCAHSVLCSAAASRPQPQLSPELNAAGEGRYWMPSAVAGSLFRPPI